MLDSKAYDSQQYIEYTCTLAKRRSELIPVPAKTLNSFFLRLSPISSLFGRSSSPEAILCYASSSVDLQGEKYVLILHLHPHPEHHHQNHPLSQVVHLSVVDFSSTCCPF
ncbi:hypothetical protein Leryth_026381 [Lithospermum erythrorhizon]|nr:hypothetical protein Leryth_026381 [Lithospermum erythrorhizon]